MMNTAPHLPMAPKPATGLTLKDRLDKKVFDALYARSLVYNTCWEDPAVDRQALGAWARRSHGGHHQRRLQRARLCAAGAAAIHAIDANPRQNALLELKLAGIRKLEFEDFFRIFGDGYHAGFRELYRQRLRGELSAFARSYWDATPAMVLPAATAASTFMACRASSRAGSAAISACVRNWRVTSRTCSTAPDLEHAAPGVRHPHRATSCGRRRSTGCSIGN
jgi:hypothetical protein